MIVSKESQIPIVINDSNTGQEQDKVADTVNSNSACPDTPPPSSPKTDEQETNGADFHDSIVLIRNLWELEDSGETSKSIEPMAAAFFNKAKKTKRFQVLPPSDSVVDSLEKRSKVLEEDNLFKKNGLSFRNIQNKAFAFPNKAAPWIFQPKINSSLEKVLKPKESEGLTISTKNLKAMEEQSRKLFQPLSYAEWFLAATQRLLAVPDNLMDNYGQLKDLVYHGSLAVTAAIDQTARTVGNFTLMRRDSVLSHTNLSTNDKETLRSSALDPDNLFPEPVVKAIIKESCENNTAQALISIASKSKQPANVPKPASKKMDNPKKGRFDGNKNSARQNNSANQNNSNFRAKPKQGGNNSSKKSQKQ